jgi:hypothetical protein
MDVERRVDRELNGPARSAGAKSIDQERDKIQISMLSNEESMID